MDWLRRVVLDSETVWGQRFSLLIQALIFVSLVTFSIETLPDLSERDQFILASIETGIVAVFTLEYLLRVILSPRPLGFIFSFFGLIDLLAILPFYLSSGIDLRTIRVLRVFRLFRVFKLVRYSRALARYHQALRIAWEELVLFLIVTVMLLYFTAVGIYYFENEAQPEEFASIFHSLWWSVITLTTVGYGDVYPITWGGRFFTMFVLLIGLGIVSIPAGLLASALSKAREMEEQE